MRKFTYIFALLIFTAPLSFAENGDSTQVTTSLDRDKQVSLEGKVSHNIVYFKLLMLNESKDGFYSMVKEHANGEFESVDVRQMVANTINSPLLYSFSDEAISDMDVTYVLYRISDETIEVQRWKYCVNEKQLCPDSMLASK